MEDLSNNIIDYFVHNFDLKNTDYCAKANLKYFKKESNEDIAINFTNLEYEALVVLLKSNEKLLIDYFKYGFYKFLKEEERILFFNDFFVSSRNIKNVIEYILNEKNLVIF
jgi:hypothetical protein